MPVTAESKKRAADVVLSNNEKKARLEMEGAEIVDRATAVFTVVLTAGSMDDVVDFSNKAATFLHEQSPFKGKPATSKLNATTRASSWLASIMKKAYVSPSASKNAERDIKNLCGWVWDHKLRKAAAKAKKWIFEDITSAGSLTTYINPPRGTVVTSTEPVIAGATTLASASTSGAPVAAATKSKDPAEKKAKAPRKPRAKTEPAAPRPPKKARVAPDPLPTGDLVALGTVPLSGAKMYQDIFCETSGHASQMMTRVKQGAQRFQGKPITGDITRPAFSFKTDKSPARDADLSSFKLKSNGIAYSVGGSEKRHEFSPAAIRTLYDKDGARCGPPQGGSLAQTSTIGNMNKAVEGLTRVMRAAQAPGSRMRPTAAITIVATTEKTEGGVEKPRSANLYLFEGGDPGGKESYNAKFNHTDARAPLLTKGTTLPSVNLEVDTSDAPTLAAIKADAPPGPDGLDAVHTKALVAESVALATTMLGLEPGRVVADTEDGKDGSDPAFQRARAAVQRFNKAMIDMGIVSSYELVAP